MKRRAFLNFTSLFFISCGGIYEAKDCETAEKVYFYYGKGSCGFSSLNDGKNLQEWCAL